MQEQKIKKIFNILFTGILILLITSIKGFSQENWELVKDDDQIKVYLNKNSKKDRLTHVKATSVTEASLNDCYELLKKVEEYKTWMHGVEEIKIIKKYSPDKFTYYMLTDFPWPAKDRDVIIKTQINYNKNKGIVYTVSKNVRNLIQKKEDIKRIKDMNASWKFKEIQPNKIKIIYEGRILSSVKLPGWLKKHVSYIGPFNTIQNIREKIDRDS
jgi:ribosome-associated toxin RatA of RatAB toxin-antitoxin module